MSTTTELPTCWFCVDAAVDDPQPQGWAPFPADLFWLLCYDGPCPKCPHPACEGCWDSRDDGA